MSEIEYAKTVGKNIRRIAYEHGKTQADIARDLNIHKATISSWMNGTRTPKMDKIDLLCHYFNCRRSDIMEEQSHSYYFDEKSAETAQRIFDDPDLRALFDAAEGVKSENLQLAAEMLRRFKETNPDG